MSRFSRTHRFRILAILFGFVGMYGLLLLRAAQLQIRADQRVSKIEERQFVRKLILYPQRGTIFDAQGRTLAVNLQVPSVYADPHLVENAQRASKKLAPFLKISSSEIYRKIKDKSRRFVWLKRHVDPQVKKKLDELRLSGIATLDEGTRFYPEKQLAAQVMGIVGVDGEGLEGVERYYDHYLRSEKLVVRAQKDAKGRSIFDEDTILMEPEPGADLDPTLDAVIQNAVEKELFEAARTSRSQHAMAFVMNPNDGRILAIASYPSLNPNRIDLSKPEWLRNRPVEELFEPGSTFKIFAIAAALEANIIQPGQSILCRSGSLQVNGKTIRTHEPHDWLKPADILKYSDNIGTSRIALALGKTRMFEMLKKLGFGNASGIDFPGDPKGMLKPPDTWRDVDLANISFGQGVAVTAVQLVSALSMIANGGFPIRPHLVDKIKFSDGRELELEHPALRQRVISERTVNLLRDWMEGVTKDGTGVQARVPGFTTAGKTGTAQKIDPKTGKYSEKRVVSSFLGFVPSSNPRLAAVFIFDDPANFEFGSALAAPVFRKAMETSLAYLGIPPDEDLPQLEKPKPVARSKKSEPINSGILPDVRGLTIREVLSRAQDWSVDLKIIGSGVAVRQIPEAGERITNLRKVEIFFEPRSDERGPM